MKKLSIAVVGIGYWGPNIIRNLQLIPNISKIYACDLKEENLREIKKKYPTVSVSSNYQMILSNYNIDAVIISTPISTHFQLSKMALQAGKHVLIEKPITTSTFEAKKIINLAKKQNRIIMAGHTFVYSETVKKMKQIIQKGNLGRIYYYDSTRINLGLLQKDTNVIWDLVPHDLSIMLYLFNKKPLSVQAFDSTFIGSKQELAHIFIRFENNISAHIHVSWLSPVKIRSILIGGSKKMIVYNDLEPSEKIKIYDKGITLPLDKITPFTPAYRSGDIVIPRIEQKEALLNELSHFVSCIINNKKPITSGKEGLKIVSLLQAIEIALKTKSEVIV